MNLLMNQLNRLPFENHVEFGLESLPSLVFGKRKKSLILITSTSFVNKGVIARIIDQLFPLDIHVISNVSANPKIEEIEAQFDAIRNLNPDLFIALGGGSVIDTAKALARRFSISPKISLMEFLQQNQAANIAKTVPIIAVPTTSGTGSEVTPFASVWSLEFSKKFSISGTDLLPISVILDPRLTDSLPKNVTLSSGMDTISHALESLWNRNRTEASSRYAIRSLELSLKSLPKLMEDLSDSKSRDKMLLSSFLGGLAIAKTRTALAHSISYPLTAKHGVPHGIACSFALPQILEFNAEKEPKYFDSLAIEFNFKNVSDFTQSIQQLLEFCKIKEELLKNIVGKKEVINLIDEMLDPTRAGNNIREASTEEIRKIIEKAAEMLNLP